MSWPLGELRKLQQYSGAPVICAGDIFDKWNPPAELINFAMQHLPEQMYCIPGQHDLSYHNYEDIKKTGYATLAMAGRIINVKANPIAHGRVMIHAFPWGKPIEPMEVRHAPKDMYHIAVVHAFIWSSPKNAYTGAPDTKRVNKYYHKLKGYHYAVFGDNHKGFVVDNSTNPHPTIVNCGGFMRRTTDQVGYDPAVYVLCRDGKLRIHHLSTSGERILSSSQIVKQLETEFDASKFIDDLEQLGVNNFDFAKAVKVALENNDNSEVRKIILKALEKRK